MSKKLLCYNRGCGQNYDPSENGPESCRHHIGVPVFHDAYKGWSCCKKKCTDFTEFLNIKGCTLSYHTNEKPLEPEKQAVKKEVEDLVVEYKKPLQQERVVIKRPPFDSPLVTPRVEISASLKEQLLNLKEYKNEVNDISDESIPIGTTCKNNSCKAVYEGSQVVLGSCLYHPGYPVFHEGLKFWSCCTKKTTDFDVFLNLVGCHTGEHKWIKEKISTEINCRLDWHQTASHVYVTVFGKKCDPKSTQIQLSPVRIKMSLYFPEQGGFFVKDMELRGIISIEESSVLMTPTKVEIKMKKKEAGSWSKLEIPREQLSRGDNKLEKDGKVTNDNSQVESVDLSCI